MANVNKYNRLLPVETQIAHYRVNYMHGSAYTMWIELVSLQNPRPRMLAKFIVTMELEMLEPTSLTY